MVLELIDVEKSYGSNKVLDKINLKMNIGEIVAVIGQSGSGKTTLLRCINGLEICEKGSIRIAEGYLCKEEDGKVRYASRAAARNIRKKLGMVFQSYNLFPHKTVLENITEAPINIYRIPRAKAEKEAYELLKDVGLEDKAAAYPFQLSGGQKQRVAIARACALNPSIMCFDEPTSALDPELREGMASTMKKLAVEGMAILLITHDMNLVKRVADRVVFMECGKILQEGTKEDLFSNISNEKLKKFILSA